MRKFGIVMLMPLVLFAQELIGTFSIDTNIYTVPNFVTVGFSGPYGNQPIGMKELDQIHALLKKGTDQLDFFTLFRLKVGSITIPNPPTGTEITVIYFSQTFLDDDLGWEFVVDYQDTINDNYSFKVIDDNGSILLSDNDWATYGFDGQNTYVFAQSPNLLSFKVWKFRSNISPASHPLSKTSSTPGPIMAYMPSGDFRVSLQPVSSGTSLQIFDMLGRQVFSKNIHNIREPTSFIIPSYSMPNTPFVARVNNDNGSFVKKGVPVR